MIDYGLLADAIRYYEIKGYKRVESPWLVTKAISDLTKPKGATSYIVQKDNEEKQKVFVASGEQSFLYLINKGFLPPGKYQTITPCMRNDAFDIEHTKYFMKLELIEFTCGVFENREQSVRGIIIDAMNFFDAQIVNAFPNLDEIHMCDVTQTATLSWDIKYKGIEIGSYGHRECPFCQWIYGTGLAEPRFSRLL